MATAPALRRQYDSRDFNPHTRPEDLIFPLYKDRLARREAFSRGAFGDGAIQSWKYRRPVGRDEHEVEHPTDPSITIRVPSVVGDVRFSPNQRVYVASTQSGAAIVGNPGAGDKGLADRDAVQQSRSLDVLGIERADPDVLSPGAVEVVRLFGFGFNQSPIDTFEAVRYNESTLEWESDSLVNIVSPNWVSATEVTATFTVSLTAPVGYLISVRVERAS